ncbi:TPA: lactococcin 972 family bacteriocin [Streptococcus suis]|uniref:lactococcin 972 family bacteriocin n=1 Tax=Streptococcus TaxID=1301 RepID=UPI00235504C7|nr:lactococcin 972 family bacteriocin [Streptococcus orisratti]MCI7676641.1 lactococcin 972 family bacteriocin [Streptococcus orisratti]MDY4001265.1 lactococcin 972 family bacteriocin [Streptococcus orisratti]MDY5636326.1 lactococcin 972 family bacteriocin [Streptococcus orisratti]HEL2413439.1 lactococcin 972 family bacteriocin [Streptococcus suis]
MKVRYNVVKICTVILLSLAIAPGVLAAQNIYGGVWSYGGHHDPNNWGAFSNYYHRTRRHWSNVIRASDSKANYSEVGANATSTAFINTSVGEVAYFNCGVK